MRGATRRTGTTRSGRTISIHTPHAGSDSKCKNSCQNDPEFQSTLPMRGATGTHLESGRAGSISIHTPHAGSDIQQPEDRGRRGISIHTPHAGSDLWHCQKKAACCYFNPHSPCGERPLLRTNSRAGSYFNPHSPCGERRYTYDLEGITMDISIHTPHAGSDEDIPDSEECPFYFNPHSPCGERRRVSFDHAADIRISIHTPHAGSDWALYVSKSNASLFQSTLPMRGAT